MIDVISGGRFISGMVRGTRVETVSTNINPVENRERFEECYDLPIKTWTTPGPFRREGKHLNFQAVNPGLCPSRSRTRRCGCPAPPARRPPGGPAVTATPASPS